MRVENFDYKNIDVLTTCQLWEICTRYGSTWGDLYLKELKKKVSGLWLKQCLHIYKFESKTLQIYTCTPKRRENFLGGGDFLVQVPIYELNSKWNRKKLYHVVEINQQRSISYHVNAIILSMWSSMLMQ